MEFLKAFRTYIILLALSAWLPAMNLGIRELLTYAYQPGTVSRPPLLWPAGAPLRRTSSMPQLLLFLDARDPASREAIAQLPSLTARSEVSLIVSEPAADLGRAARAIPHVRVIDDPQRLLARVFRATGSGQVLLYGSGGDLEFAGPVEQALAKIEPRP